ncbi:MAG: N-acetylmuramoyl-L-alanine amidase [Planctomycetota bacterium]
MSRPLCWLCLVVVVVVGCAPEQPPVEPTGADWAHLPSVDYVAHPYGKFLSGRCIGLDPGHGGDHDQLKQVEARANLAVALQLQRFLERDGARVVLTRSDDRHVPLSERVPLLMGGGAEVMVSLHHNAGGSESANYTSTWYNLAEDDEPADLDLARAIQRRVMEALRTPATVPTPLLSDRLIAPRSGFHVLRSATMPAVLCEASFYTNPAEARRLQDPAYLRRQAYGYYQGLVDYFAGGTPTVALRKVAPLSSGGRRVTLHLDDGLIARGGWGGDVSRVLASTIRVTLGENAIPFQFDPAKSLLHFRLTTSQLTARLEVRFENLYKHSNYPTRWQLVPTSGSNAGLALNGVTARGQETRSR